MNENWKFSDIPYHRPDVEALQARYDALTRRAREARSPEELVEIVRQRDALLAQGKTDHPRFRFAHEIAEAELVVMAAPFWDLSFPALLKVYIEQVSVDGITFGSTESGLQGLCRASQLVFLTTRGGFYTGDAMEMGSRYLDALHTFFGIGAYTCIAADGMDVAGFDAAASLAAAIDRAKALARTF